MRKLLLLGLLLPFLIGTEACQSEETASSAGLSPGELLPGLASPVYLSSDTTLLLLEDYFMDAPRVDTFYLPEGISGSWTADRSALQLINRQRPPLLSTMRIEAGGQTFDLLLKGPRKQEVTFSLPDKGYTSVQMKGEMNAWNPQTAVFEKKGELWTYTFYINPGRYQYLYVVDEQEMQDPANETLVSNGIGGYNNLLVVGRNEEIPAPSLYTLDTENDQIRLGSEGELTSLFAFWQNHLLEARQGESGAIGLSIPKEAVGTERSYVRVYGYGPGGLSNDLLIPLSGNAVVREAEQLTRFDKEAQIMYFPLMDRFNNGNPKNDDPVEDDRLIPKTNYQGGDLAGITQKIADGYLESLHVSALWLSPITQNPEGAYQEWPQPRRWYSGYHGYWPIRSSKIDYRFGTEQEMRELVSTAHDKEVNVYLDYVCNHVHKEHPLYRNHPDWATDLYLEDSVMNIRIWEEQRLTTWFDHFLPTLDLSNPEVVDVQTDSTLYWILEYGLDGYRHDATKHIPADFWRTLTRKLKEEVVMGQNRPIYQIGETYGSRELIQSYIGSGLLDAQFDFNLYFEVRDVFVKDESSFEVAVNSLQESFNYYGHHSTMGYITGNHDQPRFISLAGGDLAFDESAVEAGFAREIGVGDPIGYDRLQMLAGFLFSIPGIPVIYYGDEIGMPGAGDPDNRRMMRFDSLSEREAETLAIFRKLTALRSGRLSMTYGDTEILTYDEKSLALARTWFDELSVAVFNKSRELKTITFELPERYAQTELSTYFDGKISREGARVSVELPPWSFDILTN